MSRRNVWRWLSLAAVLIAAMLLIEPTQAAPPDVGTSVHQAYQRDEAWSDVWLAHRGTNETHRARAPDDTHSWRVETANIRASNDHDEHYTDHITTRITTDSLYLPNAPNAPRV